MGAGVLVLVALVIAAVLLCARSAQENIFFIWNFPSHVDPPADLVSASDKQLKRIFRVG